jgi:uncharacterized protein (DUF2249 family)
MTTGQEPILASWKISEVLQKHPDLLDYLADLTPAFNKLRNPMIRKVQTRLVTVEQAARIAGIDPRVLVRKLNQAAGITPRDTGTTTETAGPAPTGPPAWFRNTEVSQGLDVRPMLERGEEPFKLITIAARTVPVGQVLRLIVGFEPLPLYDALGKQGFAHWGEQDEDGTWHVEFLRERDPGKPVRPASSGREIDWDEPAATEVTIDVSELVPPEPMVKILQALETMPDGGRLLVHHVRRPIHLYDRLDEMGYAHDTREIAPDHVEVLIEKPARVSSPS